MGGTGLEIEIKLPVSDAAKTARRLRRLGARSLGRVHERNTLFDTPDRSLGRSGRVLRVRSTERVAARGRSSSRRVGQGRQAKGVLTYKTPVEGSRYKVRQETEVAISSPEQLERILQGLGYQPWFCYEKFRTTYRLPGFTNLLIDLDETPIGAFLELEGSPAAIDDVAGRLGYGPQDYLRESYYELFERERTRGGFEQGRMLFSTKI